MERKSKETPAKPYKQCYFRNPHIDTRGSES